MGRNLYEVLGIEPTATLDQIKRAYRKLAAELHPDHGGDADTFADVAKAYEVLGDPERRARYDATGQTEIDERATLIASTVAALAVQAFEQVFAGCNPVTWMCDRIDHTRSDNKRQAAQARGKASDLRNRLERFAASNDESIEAFQVIRGAIESQIRLLEQKAVQHDNEATLGTEMLAYLNGLRRGDTFLGKSHPSRDRDRLLSPSWVSS